jgi:hypothetical protein
MEFLTKTWLSLKTEFWVNVWVNLLAAIALTVLAKLAWVIWSSIWPLVRPFSLTGSWTGTCRMPSYPPDVEATEIYRIVVRKEHVTFSFFNYHPDLEPVRKYIGSGILRGRVLSAFYYSPSRDSSDSGVLALRLIGLKLRGHYAQYDLQKDELLMSSGEMFELTRIKVPMFVQLRMMFGRKPFPTHAKAKEYVQRSTTT